MKTKFRKPGRLTYGLLAFVLTATAIIPALNGTVLADGQVTVRSIEMSDSKPSATAATYDVSFKPATTEATAAIIVDFCANSPIPGDDCSATGGTDVPDVTSVTNAGGGGETVSAVAVPATGNKHTVKITGAALTAGTTYSIELGGITNPSATGTFYARIFTYANATNAAVYSPVNSPSSVPTEGTYVDYGGIALSTAEVINITAKVMETLSFCVYKNGGTCGQDPSITIGHTVGTTKVIDSSKVDAALNDFSLSTNAQSGADIRLKGDTLKNGANSIAAIGATSTMTCGTAAFGVDVSTAGTNLAATTNYTGTGDTTACPTTGAFGFVATNTTSTYGDLLAQLSGPTNNSVSSLTWAATASNTTPAGVYTAAEQLIATGKF